MKLEKIKDLLDDVQHKISRLETKWDNILNYDDIEFDYENADERFQASELGKILDKLGDAYYDYKYLNKEIKLKGKLEKNSDGRWEVESTYHYYTSGSRIEFYHEEYNEWIKSSVEHNGEYYIVGYKDVEMNGLKVRVR